MKRLILFLGMAAGVCSPLRGEEAVTLQQVVTQPDLTGYHVLDQGYRGKFTQVFDDRVPVLVRRQDEMEFTHVRCESPKPGEDRPVVRELAIGLQPPGKKITESYMAPALLVKALPTFEELKGLKTIEEFERLFGKSTAPTDSWGDSQQLHSSLCWLAFVPDETGAIRVVDVAFFTVDNGKGWEIESRLIKEGQFLPTGKPPQPVAQEGAAAPAEPVKAKPRAKRR